MYVLCVPYNFSHSCKHYFVIVTHFFNPVGLLLYVRVFHHELKSSVEHKYYPQYFSTVPYEMGFGISNFPRFLATLRLSRLTNF